MARYYLVVRDRSNGGLKRIEVRNAQAIPRVGENVVLDGAILEVAGVSHVVGVTNEVNNLGEEIIDSDRDFIRVFAD